MECGDPPSRIRYGRDMKRRGHRKSPTPPINPTDHRIRTAPSSNPTRSANQHPRHSVPSQSGTFASLGAALHIICGQMAHGKPPSSPGLPASLVPQPFYPPLADHYVVANSVSRTTNPKQKTQKKREPPKRLPFNKKKCKRDYASTAALRFLCAAPPSVIIPRASKPIVPGSGTTWKLNPDSGSSIGSPRP